LVRGVLSVQLDVLAAVSSGGGEMARFRDAWAATLPDGADAGSDDDVVAEARATVLAAVNTGLAGAELEVSLDLRPRTILSPHFPDLLGFVYFALAKVLIEEPPLSRCLECGVPFIVRDRRQRFCSERHANRARYRRFRARQQAQRTAAS
jgi:hypothetical protein